MLNSMTGFARVTGDSVAGTLTCELRAVNHRFLDVQFRMPDELRAKEVELRQQVGTTINRGKVECSLHLRRRTADQREMRLNKDLVQQLGRGVAEVQLALDATADVDPIDILRWPGVVEEPELDMEPLFKAAAKLLGEALVALQAMRRSEGQRIAAMLETRCAEIVTISGAVEKRMPEVLDAVRNRQRERIEKIDIEADPDRLETELALIAQKLDVDEELDRLQSHVSEIRAVLEKNEPVGRRLDFLMQELNREANTLGSKSADSETTTAAVDLKVLIEQMREQIQNVE